MNRKLYKSALTVASMVFASRITGYLRDMVVAVMFGANAATDAFFVAFRIPNLLRRLFAEGGFSQAFVPIFTEYKEQQGHDELKTLVDRTAGTLALALFVVTALGILLSGPLIAIFAPGFLQDMPRYDLAVGMLRVTFPYLLFISLTAMAGGVLNSLGRFAVPAFTPVLLNLSMTAAALWLSPHMEAPITALAWGVFIAGVLQLAFQIPSLIKLGMLPRFRLSNGHPGVQRIMKLMLPALFGSSVAQINLLINTLIASFLPIGSISWLYYTDRFVELPLALFGVTTATVILPLLSQAHARKTAGDFSITLRWAMRFTALIVMPATLGLMLLAGPIFAALIQYRAFGPTDAQMSAISLMTYSMGLPAFVFIKILAPAFYSRQDTRTPLRIGLVSMFTNIALNVCIVWPWAQSGFTAPHAGLALATALAAYVNAGLLYRGLQQREGLKLAAEDRIMLMKILVGTVAMSVALHVLTPGLDVWLSWRIEHRVAVLVGLLALAVGVYGLALLALGVRPSHLSARSITS